MQPNRDLGSPVAWRCSLRASRARREQQGRRRRRALRGRASIALAVVASAVAAAGALAQGAAAPNAPASSATLQSGSQGAAVLALQQKLGVAADGVFGPKTRAGVRRFQRSHGLPVTGVAGAATLAALGLSGQSVAGGAVAGAAAAPTSMAATLARIAQCESGGNPAAVSASGHYRGKYQFTRATWRALGGTGDPAQAPEAVQDQLAAKLLAQRGTAPWPVCGR